MTWKKVSDGLPTEEDGKYQLVVYLKPFSSSMTPEITVGYFASTEKSHPEYARGWVDWNTNRTIWVTHWQRLPDLPESKFFGMELREFYETCGDFGPPLGSVIEP